MAASYSILLLCVSLFTSYALPYVGDDPEVNYDAIQLITSKNYYAEAHWVNTPDNYTLGIHRMYNKSVHVTGPQQVFFLQHGLLCSSTNWLTNLANESLAYILADHGFDVWMGNIRGNTYSRNHTSLSPDSKEFWDFSFDEHALIDLPAMLDYVIAKTGQEKIFYVGHSQGTIMGFAGFTANQTLASHIETFFALAPVTTVQHIQGGVMIMAEFDIDKLIELFDHKDFLPNDWFIKELGDKVCAVDKEFADVCEDVLFLICGVDPDLRNINTTRLPVYYSHTPAGTSVKNILHYTQEVKSGRFAMYDYGKEGNNKRYGTATSPSYNITQLNIPTVLFTGDKDWLADPIDVANMIPKINTTGKVVNIPIDGYEHLDFIWGLDAANRVYDKIINFTQKFLP